MQSNPRVVFAERPVSRELPVVGKHILLDTSRTIDIENVALNGGFLTKTLILSPEPAMRDRMRDPASVNYTTVYKVGGPITGFAVVVVLRSEKEGVNVGDYMYGMTTWEAYTVQPYEEGRVHFKSEDWPPGTFDMDSLALQVVPNPHGNYPLSKYTSVMGTPGLTAFVGFEGIIKGKAGETIFVSAGASGVGSVVVQLAKLKGMKVIASAGSDAKVEYLRNIGADLPFNYKKTNYSSFLAAHGPINYCWVTLEALTAYGLVAVCGALAHDNVEPSQHYRLKNAYLIHMKRITIRGFIVPDFLPQLLGRFFEEVPALMAQGKLKSEERNIHGIENTPEAIVDMLKSGHGVAGKPVVIIAQE
ncbi:hypothetical protein CPB84DRAFT_1842477 [Gymnopilus junonius]|uniref:Enoyl reductase (ER) domain-containing protein n=1 Tax=Gymnopilus junonius TaxID=109634 RepID=A0A9P5NVV2_GYMJU|nr:hypothetical protein CPB84DRAFT_1842477 [Gymnopilus junonius]